MSIVSKLLSAITKPHTKSEITKLTGLTPNQVRDAVNELSRSGNKVQTIGHGETRHYYMPANEQPRRKFAYEYIIDLIADTDEWWLMSEIASVLEKDRHSIHCSIRRIKDLGVAKIESYGKGSELAFKMETIKSGN